MSWSGSAVIYCQAHSAEFVAGLLPEGASRQELDHLTGCGLVRDERDGMAERAILKLDSISARRRAVDLASNDFAKLLTNGTGSNRQDIFHSQ